MDLQQIKELLDRKVAEYNTQRFITKDPVCIPHRFAKKQDIEISGFFAAMFAWGNRTTIINKSNELLQLMDGSPYDFLLHHQENDLQKFLPFVHRTFNGQDALYFIHFLSHHYRQYISLESAFNLESGATMKENLIRFHQYFFSLEHLPRTVKHVATPLRNAACKRINMFLRWMVRNDLHGVDFGIWKQILPKDLICPLDVHVCNVAFRLGLLDSNKANWKQAEKLTEVLRFFDSDDPVKYDFALFALGAEERWR